MPIHKIKQDESRLDQWIRQTYPQHSRTLWQQKISDGVVRVDGRIVSPRFALKPGHTVEIDDSALKTLEPESSAPTPQNIRLSVIYEDDDILVIDKAPGMVVHPGNGVDTHTVVHAALSHTDGNLANLGDEQRPGIVHRLDRETSGVLVLAKTTEAGTHLQKQFHDRKTEKIYDAVVLGTPKELSGTIKESIGRHPKHRTRMAVVKGGRKAISHWHKIHEKENEWSWLQVRIETGRTHQIRVHLASIGHPILGDSLYGYKSSRLPKDHTPPPRILLHARCLKLEHPTKGHIMRLEAPIPEDMTPYLPSAY